MANWLIFRAALLAAFFIVVGCGRASEDTPTPTARPIKILTVEASSNQFPFSYPAIVEAARSTTLTFQVGGLVQELPAHRGQTVKQGDLIARVDSRDFASNAQAAKAQYDNARAEYERARRLAAQDAISKSVLDQRLSQRDIARAQYLTAAKALEDTTLLAPFDGQIADVMIEQYQNVAPQTAVAVLQTEDALEATINIPAQIISHIPGFTPSGTIIILDSAPDLQIPASFKEITTQADPTSQTYATSFTFEPPEHLNVLPGMTGTIETTLIYDGPHVEAGVSVPFASVFVEGDDYFVWVVDTQTMSVTKRAVTLAEFLTADTLTIVAGLEGGEAIAGAGAAYLHEGMRVRAWQP